jgi:hypothetical protein
MADYYAYLIGVDGRVSKRVPIVCDNDEEAKRFAHQMVDGHALELWQDARKIATFERLRVWTERLSATSWPAAARWAL